MSDAFIPTNDAVDNERESLVEEIESGGGVPLLAPEADAIEQAEEPSGDDELDEY